MKEKHMSFATVMSPSSNGTQMDEDINRPDIIRIPKMPNEPIVYSEIS